ILFPHMRAMKVVKRGEWRTAQPTSIEDTMREIAQLHGCARTTMRHFWTLVALIADAFGRRHLVAATMMAFTAAIAGAQFPQSVQPGVRVRVWLPEVDQQENGPWHRQ